MGKVKENLLRLQEEIAPYTPKIVAVTKYYGTDEMIEAYNAGIRDFGESRIPESIEKIKSLPAEIQKNSKFHLIGHLQTNKVKKAVGFFDYIHSVDSLNLAQKISEDASEKKIIQKIFLQVNNAGEEQKFGFSKETLFESFREIQKLQSIEIVGLMSIAPLTENEEYLLKHFQEVFQIKCRLEQEFNCKIKELSMGMSNDYKEAVKAGATVIRVGRKLFSL